MASHYVIETMIEACREVRFRADEPKNSVSMANHGNPAKP